MSVLRVRAYNVLFGDAVLLSIPDRDLAGAEVTRHVLIDLGNVLAGRGGQADVFLPIFEDIEQQLAGAPLDLYVMTHEHLDHVQGLLHVAEQHDRRLQVEHAWLTASAEPGYYDRPENEEAQRRRRAALAALDDAAAFLKARGAAPHHLQALLEANDSRSTEKCVAFLRDMAAQTSYVYRGWDPAGHHPFREARFTVWAPERNTAVYYGRFRPMQVALTAPDGRGRRRPLTPEPPAGVDLGAFTDLVDSRRHHVDTILAIDRAANDTSVVLCIEWRGWRLLFAGDAEHRSWREMNRHEGLLGPVHLLKIGHHGSHNACPPPEILERILPATPVDDRARCAVLSTCEGVYGGVPHAESLARFTERVGTIHRTDEAEPGGYVEVEIEG